MTIAELQSLTLKLEIAVAVAEDQFTAKRARLENGFAEERGWKLPLKASQFRQMNGYIDVLMMNCKESIEMTRARQALKEHNWKVGRMKAGYLA